jgi:hypothetical protein
VSCGKVRKEGDEDGEDSDMRGEEDGEDDDRHDDE